VDEEADNEQLEALLDFVRDNRGFDFTGYKRSSLRRRVLRRIETVRCADFESYQQYLADHDAEFGELFNTILINVTSFFRDPETWAAVAEEVIPKVLSDREPPDSVRVWVPGAASGEEAFTIAILLCEAMGEVGFRERVKIYATDVDLDALSTGRHAVFRRADLEETMGPDRVERFFHLDDSTGSFRKELRRSLIFGRHDLIQDPPISRIDLLSCRNTLMYFTAPAQMDILRRFNFSLRDRGFLLLGRAETLAVRSSYFAAVDLKRRLFVARSDGADRRHQVGQERVSETTVDRTESEVRVAGFEVAPAPQVLIDAHGLLSGANQQARVLLGLTGQDLGRPLQDLELSYRPLELRSRIDTVAAERQQVIVRGVEVPGGTEVRAFDVMVTPLAYEGAEFAGTSVSFFEVTAQRRLEQELDQARGALDTAYEELQSTVEELETTNEELQSTNEELETTNEELQSTNEELETMNAELQSTNEELETINDELRQRTNDLNELNSFLESILTSLQSAVIVVDRDVRIQIWNQQAAEMWGLRDDEVEREHLMNLDIGLPVEQLNQAIRACLTGEVGDSIALELDAVNRRGRAIRCRTLVTPLRGAENQIVGAIILLDTIQQPVGNSAPQSE
jgi:two-component system, chemotaxis family, CheB/CheR fusion protein